MPGQTLHEIKALLAAAGLAPQHRFGQNFLIDLNLLAKVAAAAELEPADVVLEVGPGTGSLSELILASGARLIAVEIDRGLQELLAQRLGAEPRFTLICGDALANKNNVSPALTAALAAAPPALGGARKLVANLPYQIATPLILELLSNPPRLERLVVTIQKEVAHKLRARPRSDAYGPLAIIAQTLADIELLATLPPAAFWPRPDVDSALVRLKTHERSGLPIGEAAAFVDFVRLLFRHRRKTLRAGAVHVGREAWLASLPALGLTERSRPEELDPPAWLAWYRSARHIPESGAC